MFIPAPLDLDVDLEQESAMLQTLAIEQYELCTSWMKTDHNYVLYYINIARNTMTALVPLVVLVVLNLLVYKHLGRRRAFTATHTSRQFKSPFGP